MRVFAGNEIVGERLGGTINFSSSNGFNGINRLFLAKRKNCLA